MQPAHPAERKGSKGEAINVAAAGSLSSAASSSSALPLSSPPSRLGHQMHVRPSTRLLDRTTRPGLRISLCISKATKADTSPVRDKRGCGKRHETRHLGCKPIAVYHIDHIVQRRGFRKHLRVLGSPRLCAYSRFQKYNGPESTRYEGSHATLVG